MHHVCSIQSISGRQAAHIKLGTCLGSSQCQLHFGVIMVSIGWIGWLWVAAVWMQKHTFSGIPSVDPLWELPRNKLVWWQVIRVLWVIWVTMSYRKWSEHVTNWCDAMSDGMSDYLCDKWSHCMSDPSFGCGQMEWYYSNRCHHSWFGIMRASVAFIWPWLKMCFFERMQMTCFAPIAAGVCSSYSLLQSRDWSALHQLLCACVLFILTLAVA